ncbi:gliding motility-associated C-terminal domain-containing protein [Labilibaculum sp.]|uniref:gliding motility-associated C-terminal domain-containing protein n=1 Tax=Labilibaculum sp. TaxID=2060723 RepID=UPI003562D11C
MIFVFLSSPLFSQITAGNASYTTTTQYSTSSQDEIYVFCDEIGTGVGELTATPTDGSSGWTFNWTKWNSSSSSFSTSVSSLDTSTESLLTNLQDGLYRVEASNGTDSFEDQAWVLNNSNSQPTLTLSSMDCVGLYFYASFAPLQLQYFDIPSATLLDVSTEGSYTFTLLRNGEELDHLSLSNYDGSSKSFVDDEAFEDEKSYTMRVTDPYSCSFISESVTSSTYVVEAGFSIDPMDGEAPLEVEFENESVNADDFEWYLYQDFDRIEDATELADSLLVDDIVTDEDPVAYTYEHPGYYYVKLIVSSDKGPETCIDEYTLIEPVEVDTSLVQVPNVFTPNGDGQNDEFKVKSQSLKSFKATIFNRWGRVVYSSQNPDEGWNGKVNGKLATPGTYFYVIKATGEEEEKKTYTKKGSFMLIRN